MKKRTAIAIFLFVLLTTITSQQKIVISKFNLKTIDIENNFILKDKDVRKLLISIYDKNLFFLKNKEIETILIQNSFIESYKIRKKYPNTLKIKIFEKKPIAILIDKNKKFYLSDKIDLIKFKEIQSYKSLPYVFGNKKEFKVLYYNLKKMSFPINLIKKYTLYESNRWDLETINLKVIKLPSINYTTSLENYLNLKNKSDFKKYNVFDYRVSNQLILK